MDLGLKDKTVIITGATKGIGEAARKLFLEEGATVIAIARDTSSLQQSDKLIPFNVDVSDSGEIEKFKSLIGTRFPRIDVLVNNVGTNIRKSTQDYSEEDFSSLVNTNMKSAWAMCRAVYPLMKSNGGSIVNISSVASARSIKTSTLVYAMTKAGVNQMTEFLSTEWGKDNIRVNAILPWYIRTPLVKSVLEDPEKLRPIIEKTPLGRVGEPAEVADLIVYLSSSRASYISGVLVPVDGGFLTS